MQYHLYSLTLTTTLSIWWLLCLPAETSARPRGSAGGNGNGKGGSSLASAGSGPGGEVISSKVDSGPASEPSCEQLRAMWRFSKRQSRAAEITNEIPTYRDPFANNIWEPYAYSRTRGGLRGGGVIGGSRYRSGGHRPVYGRVVHKAPISRPVSAAPERNRAFEEVARLYGTMHNSASPHRRVTSFRMSGGQVGLTPHSGSFQHLKELIRTERARELQEQRMAEEMAARAAVLKEMTGSSSGSSQRKHSHSPRYVYDIEEDIDRNDGDDNDDDVVIDESRGRHGGGSSSPTGLLTFPDLLAPSSSSTDTRYVDDYLYDRAAAAGGGGTRGGGGVGYSRPITGLHRRSFAPFYDRFPILNSDEDISDDESVLLR